MSTTTWSGGGGFSDISLVHPAVSIDQMNHLIDLMAKVKPRWVRTICAWNYITKTRVAGDVIAGPTYGTAPFAYQPPATKNRDWSSLDRCVNEVLRRIPSADILLIVGQGKPKWSGFVSPPSYSDYGDFCVEVANRYEPGVGLGIAPDLRAAGRGISNFEIWNEQNNKGFWTWGNVNPKGYVQMLGNAYTKLKAAHPSCTVVFGSYQHVPHTGPWYGYGWMTQPESDWWSECFDNGLGDTFDVVGAHPYSLGDYEYGLGPLEPSLTLSDAWTQFQSIRNLLVTKGYGGKPFWITEIGYPTSMCTPQQQMDYHLESMAFWQTSFDFIDAYMIYCLLEDGNDPTDKEQTLGIVSHDGLSPKPMYYYLLALQGGLIQAPAFTGTAAMPAPTIQTSMTITVPPMTATADLDQNARVLTNVIIVPPMAATATVTTPTIQLGTTITMTGVRMSADAGLSAPGVTVNNPPPVTEVEVAVDGPSNSGNLFSVGPAVLNMAMDIPGGLLSPALLLGVEASHSYQASYATYSTLQANCDSVAMTQVGSSDVGGSYHLGSIHWFYLANPNIGLAKNIHVGIGSSAFAMRSVRMKAFLLQGAIGVGDRTSNKSANYWTVSTNVNSGPHDRIFLLVGSSKQVTSSPGAAIRYNDGDAATDGDARFMMISDKPDDGDGSGSTNISATFGSCAYGMIGLQVEFDPSLLVLLQNATAMTAAAAMPAPVIHTGVTVTAPPMTAVAAMPAPVIPIVVIAPPMTATAAMAAPTATSGLTVTAPPMTATAALTAPAINGSMTVVAPPMTATADLAVPVLTAGDTVVAPPMTATAAAAAPVVTSNVTVTAPPMTATAGVAVPAVASDVTVTAPPMTATAIAAAPAVFVPIIVTAPPMTVTAAVAVPVLKIAYDLAFSGTTLPTSGVTGQPNVVGNAAYSAATGAIPTHQAGDLIFVCAFRDGSATLPTSDANYVSYKTQTGTSCSMRIGVRKATTSSEPAPSYTNATEIVILVVRGCDNPEETCLTSTVGSPASGVAAGGSGTGGTITYPAATLLHTDSTSVVLRFAGQRDATNLTTNAPTGYSQAGGVATGVCAVKANANASSNPTADTQSTNGTTGWIAITIELVAATVSFGTCLPVAVSSSTMREGDSEAATDGDYYEAWLHPSPMNTDVYTSRANSGALTTGSGRGMGACVGVPNGTAPFSKALIGIASQQTATGWAILTWDGVSWTTRASATGSGTSSGTSDDIGIRISKSAGIYTYTLQKNQVDTTLSWTDSGAVFGTPGPRWGAAFKHTRATGVQGGSPGVDEVWSADT